MDLWEGVLHAGLVGDNEAEGGAREGRAASGVEEEDEAVAWSYYDTVLLGKLRKAVRRETDREGEGASSRMTNARKPGDRLQRFSGRSIRTCMSPPWKNLHAQPSSSMRK